MLHQSCVRKEAKFDVLNRQRGCEAGSGLWRCRVSENIFPPKARNSIARAASREFWFHGFTDGFATKKWIPHGGSRTCTRMKSKKTKNQPPKQRENEQANPKASGFTCSRTKKKRKTHAASKVAFARKRNSIFFNRKRGCETGTGPCVRLKNEDLEA